MNVEKQVCTREQAVKLKDLGIAQKSLFHHGLSYNGDGHDDVIRFGVAKENKRFQFAAFTVSELGAMLPKPSEMYETVQPLLEKKYGDAGNDDNMDTFFASLFNANDVADMLIYLLENNHITSEEVNQSLALNNK